MAITIASITSGGGITIVQVNNNGSLISDPAAAGLTTSWTVTYGGVTLPVGAVGSPTTADITLTGTWSPAPTVGDELAFNNPGGGGGGGGGGGNTQGVYTIDSFNYDGPTNKTQFTLLKNGTPSTDNFQEPGAFYFDNVGLTLVTQSNDPQPYFVVDGEWVGLQSGDMVVYNYTGAGFAPRVSGYYMVTQYLYSKGNTNLAVKDRGVLLQLQVGDVIAFSGSNYTLDFGGNNNGIGGFAGPMSPEPVENVDSVYVTVASGGSITVGAYSFNGGTNETTLELLQGGSPYAGIVSIGNMLTINGESREVVSINVGGGGMGGNQYIVSGSYTSSSPNDLIGAAVIITAAGGGGGKPSFNPAGRVPEAALLPSIENRVPENDLTPDVRDVPRSDLVPEVINKGTLIP